MSTAIRQIFEVRKNKTAIDKGIRIWYNLSRFAAAACRSYSQ
jgi:hypothetical protein